MKEQIKREAEQALQAYLAQAKLQEGSLLVVGCSSSEIGGKQIGKSSNLELAEGVYEAFAPILAERGIFWAVQCCEHLNRALIIEEKTAKTFGYPIVNVRPVPKAGGAFATVCYERFEQAVAVEYIRADGGIDIGGTLIGMHLKEVAVPVRIEKPYIGSAYLLLARVRPKFVGGSRACYNEDLL